MPDYVARFLKLSSMGPFTVPWLASRKCESLHGSLSASVVRLRTHFTLFARAAKNLPMVGHFHWLVFQALEKYRPGHQACRTALLNGSANLTTPAERNSSILTTSLRAARFGRASGGACWASFRYSQGTWVTKFSRDIGNIYGV